MILLSETCWTDSPLILDVTLTDEVSTIPSGSPSFNRAAPLAAESVPMPVPMSQTGTLATSRNAAMAALRSWA